MVNQIKIVSILMIVHGALTTLMGTVYLTAGPLLWAMRPFFNTATTPVGNDDFLIIATSFYVILGLPILTCGIVNIIGGVRTLNRRGRTFAIVALFLNVIPLITLYCAPTGLTVMIYGLIVFFNRDVAYAFALAAAGRSSEPYMVKRCLDDDFADSRHPSPTPPSRRDRDEGYFR